MKYKYPAILDSSTEDDSWNCVVLYQNDSNKTGEVYGDFSGNFDIPRYYKVTIPEGASLTIPENGTVTNDGTILNYGTINIDENGTLEYSGGTITNSGTITSSTDAKIGGSVKCKLSVKNAAVSIGEEVQSGTANADSVEYYIDAGVTVTVTADDAETGKCFVKWNVTGLSDSDTSKSPLQFVMPLSTVTAEPVYKTELTIANVSAKSRNYSGSKEVQITDVELSGIQGNDKVSVDVTKLTGILASADAGEYEKVTLTGDFVLTGDDADNYAVTQPMVRKPTDVTIEKAENAQNMPNTSIRANYSNKKLGDVTLSKDWIWQADCVEKVLEVGVSVSANAIYDGADKGNYETETVAVTITRSACEHEQQKTVKENEVAPTCIKDGFYDEVVYCNICGEVISTTHKTVQTTGHTWDAGKVTKQPTATQTGTMTYTCKVCGSTKTEEIAALGASKAGTILTDSSTQAEYRVTTSENGNDTVAYVKSLDGNVKTVQILATITIDGITYKVTSIADNAFANNKKLTKVNIGSNVTTIGKKAFYKCTKLKTVKIGKNVTTIGASAFYNCSKLTAVSMGSNVTTISDNAFYKCTSLAKITIPAKVKKIGKQAFCGCKNLKTITIKTTKLTSKNVGSKAFKGIYEKAALPA